jgi:hypothetical protein
MTPRVLAKQQVEAEPYSVWNAFVDFIARGPYSELTQEQRIAYLAFWYESEVNNGGHLQFFQNGGTEYLTETVRALGVLGVVDQQRLLLQAMELLLSRPRRRARSVEEYSGEAMKGEFGSLDSAFYHAQPSITEKLQEYLDQNQSSFVVIV